MNETVEIAKVILSQIIANVGKWVYFSWGCSKKTAFTYQDMPTLGLRVSGAIHKGWVYISLAPNDTYIVTTLTTKFVVKKVVEDVYCDNVGEIVDGLVERAPEWSDAEYHKKADADTRKKLGIGID